MAVRRLFLPVSGPAPAVFAGTIAVAFGQTGALAGNAALTGTAPVTFGQTGALDAGAILAGTTTLTFGQTGALDGGAGFAGTAATVFGQTGSLNAEANAGGTATLTFSQTGALNGEAGFAGTISVVFAQTGDFVAGAATTEVVAGGGGKAYRKRIIAPDGTIHEARSPRAYKELLNRLLRRIEYEQTPDAAPEQPKRKIAKTERQAIVRKLIDMPSIDYSGLIAAVETLQAAQMASAANTAYMLAEEEMAIVFLLAG